MNEFNQVYVGLDVHKATIAVAAARPGRSEPEYHGNIVNSATAVRKLLQQLSQSGEALSFCYEAGPCGYGLYRDLTALGHGCTVVAPSLIPRKAGERMKTDRRDALMLARLHRAGELTAVWVPDQEQEAIRDLTRAREDMKAIELTALPESLEEMADLAGVLSNACPSLWALAEAMEEKLAINRQRTFTARVFGGQVRHVEREGAKE